MTVSVESKMITCNYNYGNEEIGMSVSSISKSVNIRSKRSKLRKYVHIEDVNNLSESDDYIVLENEKGVKMTYFLKCK